MKNALNWFERVPAEIFQIRTQAAGPAGRLPFTKDILMHRPSGDLFGMSQNAGMGWAPNQLQRKQFLILGTVGGLRTANGQPIALGYHTGHWEIGEQMAVAAHTFAAQQTLPFAVYCTDPCDGRTQGTPGMFDSLAYRNDAAQVLRRLIRSLPTRAGVLGVATCDKGLPAMMMALAGTQDLPGILVPGGVTLPPEKGEDAGTIQSLGARFAHGLLSLAQAAELGCRACASPGGGCQFLGTAATSQVVAEALGMAVPHSALAPSGQAVWRDIARQSALALIEMEKKGLCLRDILTPESVQNAMAIHAAFGGSTNLLLHLPAIAHAAGLPRPNVDDWIRINQQVPRLVDVLPNGPAHHPTIRVFLAGGVPEVMLHLRRMGVLNTRVLTVTGQELGRVLDAWERSKRRRRFREILRKQDGVDPDTVIMPPEQAHQRGLTSTLTFPKGNLAPEGSVVKSTAIDPTVMDADGVFRRTGPAKVFVSEKEAIAAIKSGQIEAGDVLVFMGGGPLGTGMEETYQLTAALKHLPFGKYVTLITDARFSGVSTGACIGHVGPEALAGGPIGKVRAGDTIQVVIDPRALQGSLDLIGEGQKRFSPAKGARILARRSPHPGLKPNPGLPNDTRLWAALQKVSGGPWGGCVFDVDRIIRALGADV